MARANIQRNSGTPKPVTGRYAPTLSRILGALAPKAPSRTNQIRRPETKSIASCAA